MSLIIRNFRPSDWPVAISYAEQFVREFPDRQEGKFHGVGFSRAGSPIALVYRTKAGIVVRGQHRETAPDA